VLSLWHLLAGEDDVTVLTVFNGPGDGATELGWWDRLTRAESPEARAAERAQEDREALALAGREPVNLGFIDGQYRDGPQDIDELSAAIAEVAPPEALLLTPAALDNHRDHVAARDASLQLAASGREVSVYADIPHATLHGWPSWVNGSGSTREYLDPEGSWEAATEGLSFSLRDLTPDVVTLDDEANLRKREAVRCYRTQLDALEFEFGVLGRSEVLRHEVTWRLETIKAA
jgi:LmbE family N-acetylglucosaminyl deacetylase